MSEIKFYRANEKPYGAFSNLHRRPVVFEGVTFPTSEHAYQAGKPSKDSVREWLMAAPSPALLAMAAHGLYSWDIAPNWSKIKFERMKNILRAKFTQHDDLRELLLGTGTSRLVEAATVDNAVNRLWGEVNGKGQNKLGELLMEVRAEIRAEVEKKKPAKKISSAKKKLVSDSLEIVPTAAETVLAKKRASRNSNTTTQKVVEKKSSSRKRTAANGAEMMEA